MKKYLSAAFLFLLTSLCFSQTKGVLVNTNGRVVSPTNFWSVDAAYARTNLGLGTAATNATTNFATAAQGAKADTAMQSNQVYLGFNAGGLWDDAFSDRGIDMEGGVIHFNGGGGVANIAATSLTQNRDISIPDVSGTIILDSTSKNFPSIGIWDHVNNVQCVSAGDGFLIISNLYGGIVRIEPPFSSNAINIKFPANATISSSYPVLVSATNQKVVLPTNFWSADAPYARTNLGLGWSALTNTNVNQFSADTGLAFSNGTVSNAARAALATNAIYATNAGTAVLATNAITASNFVGGVIAITNGGTGTNTADAARTNLGLGVTNIVTFGNVKLGIFPAGSETGFLSRNSGSQIELVGTNVNTTIPSFYGWSGFENTAFDAATARTNLGIPWFGLTNTNSTNMLSALGGFPIGAILAITNGGTGSTNVDGVRSNLSIATNSDVQFNTLRVLGTGSATNLGIRLGNTNHGIWGSGAPASVGIAVDGITQIVVYSTNVVFNSTFSFQSNSQTAVVRTNLGLGGGFTGIISNSSFTGLFTNSTAGTQTNITNSTLRIYISNGIITNVTQ